MHRYGCILSTSARNCCIFWVRNLSRCARSRVARNLLTAKDLPEPILHRQSQPALGSHDKAHAPRGHSSRRTNHQSPRLSSLRRRDARTDASIPKLYHHAMLLQTVNRDGLGETRTFVAVCLVLAVVVPVTLAVCYWIIRCAVRDGLLAAQSRKKASQASPGSTPLSAADTRRKA